MGEKRFGCASAEEIASKIQQIHSKSTIKSNHKAERALRCYLKSRGESERFEDLTNRQLDELLSHFYINIRQQNGEKYKSSSLENK